ncbi:MAG TPA: hypothetical protein VJ455_12580 [Ignavibacteria bacterium]|nr:hypothetical protein [Ignavibacteria bacterium]
MKLTSFLLFILGISAFLFVSCNDTNDIFTPSENIISDNPGTTWNVPGDFATIQDAINNSNVVNGDVISVGPGNFNGALVTKGVVIKGEENTVINNGPVHGSGLIMGFRFLPGSDNAAISHLTFTVDLAIMNGGAVNNVEVSHCTFLNSIQAISNWRGSGWNINHNTVTDLRTRCGGGIGILLGDFMGGTVSGNVVSHNIISGTLHVAQGDCGGYAGTGIVLYADFRWGASGTIAFKNNFITHNSVSLISDNPALVDVWAFELTDTRDDPNTIVLFDNSIGFNDFRWTTSQISLTPGVLDNPVNNISRNLGDNRGHGLHPKDFKPGN